MAAGKHTGKLFRTEAGIVPTERVVASRLWGNFILTTGKLLKLIYSERWQDCEIEFTWFLVLTESYHVMGS